MDDEHSAAEDAVEEVNSEFGHKRVIWLPCDVSKSGLDGKIIANFNNFD